MKFEDAWNNWMKKFEGENKVKFITDDEMEATILQCLREKLRSEEKDIIKMISRMPLSKRKQNLFMQVDITKTHLKNNRYIFTLTRNDVQEANRLSNDFLSTARQQLEEWETTKTHFEKNLVIKIINELFTAIDEIDKQTTNFIFTSEYKVEMGIIICTDCYMVFKRIMKIVKQESDPIEKLNGLKGTFFTNFKSQYTKMNAEITAANSLCNYLIHPIKKSLQGKLQAKIVSHLKDSDSHFHSKRGFKVKSLTDLAKKDNFLLYQLYLIDIRQSYLLWSNYYIEDHCNKKGDSGKCIKCELAEENLRLIVKKVMKTVNNINKKDTNIKLWLLEFHECLGEELTISKSEILKIIGCQEVFNFSFFVDAVLDGIENIEADIKLEISTPASSFFDMANWSNPPHIALRDSLAGCCEVCPFCREQCELVNEKHYSDHSVLMHRPQCLAGYVIERTNQIALELCTESVNSKHAFENRDTQNKKYPFAKYKDIYKRWNIPTDQPDNNPVYWKWFVFNYCDDITKWINASNTNIPDNWNVPKDTAIASLNKIYNFTL